jgi:hypothetical protein
MWEPQAPGTEAEVVAAAHEVENAGRLVDIERHAQPCRQLFNQSPIGVNHFG